MALRTVISVTMNYITNNWLVVLIFIVIISLVANHLHKPIAGGKGRLTKAQLEYMYRTTKRDLFDMLTADILVSLNLAKPEYSKNLNSPTRWTFTPNDIAIYHYKLHTNDADEAVDLDLIENTIQETIEAHIADGGIDGKGHSVGYGDYLMPKLWVHGVSQEKNLVTLSLVYPDEKYAKNHRDNYAEQIGDSLDCRNLEDDEI
jgi:hypothetical protein